ncbi:MAG TPA: nuclear transport factor 2 family protein [Solirubrobacterales bacterium]|nr:nuclear transport factor 2 family protein [Solirubrobacterales bacterium]
MSQENVEIVRRAYVALTRGDAEVLRDLAPPDFTVDFSRRRVDPFVLRRDEMLAFFIGQSRETWEGWPTYEPKELIDAGDVVVAFIRTSARGKLSGVEVDALVWNVWTFRDGKPIKFTYFGEDRAAALQAAGLSE